MTRDTFERFATPDRGRFGDNEFASDRPTSAVRSNLVDVTLALHFETPKAFLLSQDGNEKRAFWLPKSQCEMARSGRKQGGYRRNGQPCDLDIVFVTLRQYLAREKGLI